MALDCARELLDVSGSKAIAASRLTFPEGRWRWKADEGRNEGQRETPESHKDQERLSQPIGHHARLVHADVLEEKR